jgi:hypothetical protein
MARGPITARRRNALPKSAFAYPARRAFPIDTPARARNALARAAQDQTRGTYRHVAKAVRAKWGDRVATVGPTHGNVSTPGKRGVNTRRRR